ncbi:MAG TPA: putative manganese-dependent inorganic diphosphatase [Verrucomicrobiae bacterium]
MSEIFVIGHRNPDTDSICSAIGYAEFKRRTGMSDAVAARCGDTNERIDFVLNTFGMPSPRFIADVSPKVRDVMRAEVLSVTADATAAEALGLMDEHDIRVLPVLDAQQRCRGLLSLFKLSKFLFPAAHRLIDSRRVLSSLNNLARTLGGKILTAHEAAREEDLILMVGAMKLESFAQRLERYQPEKLAVVVGDRSDIQELAIRAGARVVVVTGGLAVEPHIFDAAKQKRVSLISSPHDSSTTASLCRLSVAVRHMIHEKFLSFREDASLKDVKAVALASTFAAFPVMDDEGRTVGVLSKADFLKPVERRLILVDHNELTQAVQGADEVEILEIIDHHRLGALTTQQPILFRNEPVGSTSTIVADCFFRGNVELSKPIAGLLLAGLVSDTLNLTSPTTTAHDKEVLGKLEKIVGVNAREFTDKLFASGSLLTLKPAPQAVTTDCKEYRDGGVAFSVAQIEEVGFNQFWKRKDELLAALEDYRRGKNYFFSALMVTDVAGQQSLMLVAGKKEFIAKIDYPEPEPGVFELRDVVSRKKQLLPYFTHCLQRMKAGN